MYNILSLFSILLLIGENQANNRYCRWKTKGDGSRPPTEQWTCFPVCQSSEISSQLCSGAAGKFALQSRTSRQNKILGNSPEILTTMDDYLMKRFWSRFRKFGRTADSVSIELATALNSKNLWKISKQFLNQFHFLLYKVVHYIEQNQKNGKNISFAVLHSLLKKNKADESQFSWYVDKQTFLEIFPRLKQIRFTVTPTHTHIPLCAY